MVSRQPGHARNRWDAESIRALRLFLDVSQSVFAHYLGVRQQTVSEWETGVYRPRGASGTLLSMIAEQAGFRYPAPDGEDSKRVYQRGVGGMPVAPRLRPDAPALPPTAAAPRPAGAAPRLSGTAQPEDGQMDSAIARGYVPYVPPAQRDDGGRGLPGPAAGHRRSEVPF